MKYPIVGMEHKEHVHRYIIKNGPEIHQAFCGLFLAWGLDRDDVLREVDIIFANLDHKFIYLENKEFDIYLLITQKKVNLIIKTTKKQRVLHKELEKYFSFPL